MRVLLIFLFFLSLAFSKDIYFEGGKMSLEDLAVTVSIETKKDIILHNSLKDRIVFLRVGRVISDKKLFSYFKSLIEANGLALNKKNGFYIVSPVTDLVYFSYRFKNRKAKNFETHLTKYKDNCTLGKDMLFCNLLPKDYYILKKMVKSFDIPVSKNPYENKTLDISMKIVETNYNDLLDLKNSLSFNTTTNLLHIDSSLSQSLDVALDLFINGASVIDTASLGLAFSYLQKKGFSTVMNEPNILVTNGATTSITTGGSQRVVSSVTKNEDLTAETKQYEEFISGLQLSVKADILNDIKFKLTISLNNENVIGGTVELPITSKQSYQTTITLDKNETVVLGGVIYNKTSKENYKVPILGDIPILGMPFKNSVNTKEKKLLTIFLTVKDFK